MKVDELAKTSYKYNKSVIKLHHIKELIKRWKMLKELSFRDYIEHPTSTTSIVDKIIAYIITMIYAIAIIQMIILL